MAEPLEEGTATSSNYSRGEASPPPATPTVNTNTYYRQMGATVEVNSATGKIARDCTNDKCKENENLTRSVELKILQNLRQE